MAVSLSALSTTPATLRARESTATLRPPAAVPAALHLRASTAAGISLGSDPQAEADLGARPDPVTLISGAIVSEHLTPAAEWRGTHQFGRMPDLTLYVDGEEVDTDVYATDSTYLVSWPEPTAGVVIVR